MNYKFLSNTLSLLLLLSFLLVNNSYALRVQLRGGDANQWDILLNALAQNSDGSIIDLTKELPDEYKAKYAVDDKYRNEPLQERDRLRGEESERKMRSENLRTILNQASSRNTVIVLGSGASDYSVLSEYSDIKQVILVDMKEDDLILARNRFEPEFRNKVFLVRADILGLEGAFFKIFDEHLKSLMGNNDELGQTLEYLNNLQLEKLSQLSLPFSFADVLICEKIYAEGGKLFLEYLGDRVIGSIKSRADLKHYEIKDRIEKILIFKLKGLLIENWHKVAKDRGLIYVADTYDFHGSKWDLRGVLINEEDPLIHIGESGNFEMLPQIPFPTWKWVGIEKFHALVGQRQEETILEYKNEWTVRAFSLRAIKNGDNRGNVSKIKDYQSVSEHLNYL